MEKAMYQNGRMMCKVGFSSNLSALLCFYKSARILTARIYTSVTVCHEVFHKEIDFVSITHLQFSKLQANVYR